MRVSKESKDAYLKIFNGSEVLYQIWLNFYELAFLDGSTMPDEVAWIEFKKLYYCDSMTGNWEKRSC